MKTKVTAVILAFVFGLPAFSFALNPYYPRVSSVNTRFRAQGYRISQGVSSGSISATEAYALRSQRVNLKREEYYLRARNGGGLTGSDYRLLNAQLNARSRSIYYLKH
jgi:hypothetical protein